MGYDPHLVSCRECEWSQPMPNRETAEHSSRVHENEHPDHTVIVERLDDDGD